MKNTMYPITNNLTIELVLKKLNEANPAYNIIFRLMLETGMPLSSCVELKCCDINKNAVTFKPTHKQVVRTEPLSEELQKDIAKYLGGKGDMSYAFVQKNNTSKHMHYRAFLGALETICESLNIMPTITSQTIRKTYIYKLFISGNNVEKIYSLTDCRSIRQIYDYLGLPLPEQKDREYYQKESIRDVLVKEKLVEQTKATAESTLSKMIENLDYTKAVSYDYCREVMRCISTINEAITLFNDETKS